MHVHLFFEINNRAALTLRLQLHTLHVNLLISHEYDNVEYTYLLTSLNNIRPL